MTDNGYRPFLCEVGTDELPARFLPVERAHVGDVLCTRLKEFALDYEGLRVLATPRRLVVLIDALKCRQDDRETELKGPPLAVAYDDDGEPTRAALGFARKNDVAIADCYEVTDEKGGRFMGARKAIPGRDAAEVLAEILPPIILGIPFPKVMRWGESDLEYARPIQWLVALQGDDVIDMSLAGLRAGRRTHGHRTLAENRDVSVPAPDVYLDLMRENGVIVDQDVRREMIMTGAAKALAGSGGRLIEDEDLLVEVIDLCEHPTPFLGRYSDDFFALPAEVIVTALKSHQRYFAVQRDDGDDLLPVFLAARDGDDEALDNVIHGNQRVLVARLSDALFYWDFDRKLSPDQHVERLFDVTWIEGYGSLGDKIRRLGTLVEFLWRDGLDRSEPVPADLTRATAICKFDLVTEMIRDGKEFTKLEGVIGARYAAAAGESPEVCRILEEYHRPRSAGDTPPEDLHSTVLSMADRLDTIAGCWLAGFAPTGAKDPYALRRHTLAIQRTLIGHGLRLDLPAALEAAMAAFAGQTTPEDLAAAASGLREFSVARLERLLTGQDMTAEAVRAVLPAHGHDPLDARSWALALDGFREEPDFQQLATGFKRCRNILEGDLLDATESEACLERWLAGGRSPDGHDFSGLPEPAEQILRDQVAAAVPRLFEHRAAGDYQSVYRILSSLGPTIGDFFDHVRVNVDDLQLKQIRHGFLREIYGLFAQYADFSAVAPLENGSQ